MTSPNVATALKFLNTFETLDIATNLSLRTSTCTHIFAPSSLSMGTRNNETFAAQMTGIQPIIERFFVFVKETLEDEKSKKVVAWSTSEAIFKDDVKDDEEDWSYKGEYMFVFSFDGEGKIERIVEFIDSKVADQGRKLMAKARVNLEKKDKQ